MNDTRNKKWIDISLVFFGIPFVLAIGLFAFRDKQYDIISLILAVLSCLPFYFSFEKRQAKTAELVIIATLITIAVVGRLAFAALPGMSPVTAIAAMVGIYFGSPAGFLTGSLSAVISNVLFGQGPWTPFQMFAWGITGYMGGVLGRHNFLSNKWQLAIYGLFSGMLFSFIMDIWTVLSIGEPFSWVRYIAALGTAIPFTLIYGISNAVFLVLLKNPIGKRLARIKKKYGI
ncbi:MAG: ECF transporter S component [Clostridia bacterium]|nr:ECF transporter S component [Clostridia bacterium]